MREGDFRTAHDWYIKGLRKNSGLASLYINLSKVLPFYASKSFDEEISEFYFKILNSSGLTSPVSVNAQIWPFLKRQKIIRNLLLVFETGELDHQAYKAGIELSKIPLFIKMLEVAPVTDLEIEKLLTFLRKEFLLNRKHGQKVIKH